jgi:hypothetical protein
MGLLGVARANTAVGVSPETFLLLLLLLLLLRLHQNFATSPKLVPPRLQHSLCAFTKCVGDASVV